MQINGSVAVITGASSGIGRALSIELGLRGAIVVLAARSKEKLEETALILSGYGIKHTTIPFDITSDTSIQKLLRTTIEKHKRIDIFVNNAGVGLFQNIAHSTPKDMQMVFNTNFWGPLKIMQQLMPAFSGGMLVNISSAAAKYSPYQQGIYAASKAALERITEAMGLEEQRVKTLLVIPDRTETPFMQNVVGPKENAKLALDLKFASTEAVAKRVVNAIAKDKSVCYTTLKARIYTVLGAVYPALVKKILSKALQ
jgi:short-subunit dehydrogenase